MAQAGQSVRLAGWVHRKRDHGGLLFVDLRDHYGITQCVVIGTSPAFATLEAVRPESVVAVSGEVRARSADTANPSRPTRTVEPAVAPDERLSTADVRPIQRR